MYSSGVVRIGLFCFQAILHIRLSNMSLALLLVLVVCVAVSLKIYWCMSHIVKFSFLEYQLV